MTPFAGAGVNLAMEDALVLARSLTKRRGSNLMLTEGLQEFEKNMFRRAEASATITYNNLVGMYGRPASHTF
jgi:2-polyprenyl-6-methoxyphenol hydroxylase-like FAD-dependent oxidoreductase